MIYCFVVHTVVHTAYVHIHDPSYCSAYCICTHSWSFASTRHRHQQDTDRYSSYV